MMFNFTKKKTIFGAIGVVVSIVMAAVCGAFDKGGAIENLNGSELVIRLFCASGAALALGFAMLILFDWKMFAICFVGLEIMISLQFVTAIQISAGVAFVSLLMVGGGIFGFTLQYRSCKYNINGATTFRQQQKEQKQVENAQKMLADDDAFKSSIRYLEKSIVLCSQMGALFQVIKTEQEYYFHYIGTMLIKPDWSKCITDFDNIEQHRHKKDYKIGIADIDSISAVLRALFQMQSFGTLKIKLRNKKAKSYGFINRVDPEELTAFFGQNIVVRDKVKEAAPQEEEEITDSRKAVLNKINLARYIFSVLSIVFFAAYIFYNTENTDAAFTVLAILISLAPIVTYLVLQEYISIRDVSRLAQPDKNKINFLFIAMLFPILFALKCLSTGFYIVDYEYLKLSLYSLIPFAVLSVIFFVVCKEYKKFKSCIMAFIVAAGTFCPSFIYKVNSAFDFHQPQEVTCQVIEMPTNTAKNGEVTYYVVIEYDGKTIKTEVDEETYDQMTVGGEATVLRYHGAFGIEREYLE